MHVISGFALRRRAVAPRRGRTRPELLKTIFNLRSINLNRLATLQFIEIASKRAPYAAQYPRWRRAQKVLNLSGTRRALKLRLCCTDAESICHLGRYTY